MAEPAMPQLLTRNLLIALVLMVFLFSAGCQDATPSAMDVSKLSAADEKPTETHTPTQTTTSTPANTITPIPSQTSTTTQTPFPTLTPTASPTQMDSTPAVLFPYQDINGRTVDWSYTFVTQIGVNQFEEVNDLWAFMAFQLLDRAIHQRNLQFFGESISVYYLNVAHDFDGVMIPMQLVLGGTAGVNVAIEDIPAGGAAYIQVQVRDASQSFNPYTTHMDANSVYEHRETTYPLLFLSELQALLPTLPEGVILLADHPILFPRNTWPQIKLDMSRVNYLAARYQPFFEINDYYQFVDQSEFAYALRDHILDQQPMPVNLYAYSSQTLIIIHAEE